MTIYFYTTNKQYGEFSNFSKHGIELDGLWWKTTEHYFQAQKFSDPEYREKIRLAPDPKAAANLGRSRKVPIRKDWESVKDDVMRMAVQKKFTTHPELRELLVSTGAENIVENAPGDYYWGCGADGSGKNMLGIILQEVRDELLNKS
ncbi:MAG: NADAR family protein [Candidatus Thiodiazotropha sp. (ex Lucina aurantia)]|nr:NADAR family protein [Candidatus Thiodiazotropha sp. (ex Lucina pensylvanica)]MBV2100771.1 NADAR family protein [Candidatus Thiodiazotropha sp. (ex Codakia orbicularis)]MBV2104500.1 NADAR family protein [Candidatus Thiodiazotropha sp. (ex Lucina aurantia)]MBV2119057.1 NADAR family protein [Candidatus Thiodiazotropha sp. (ex Lucina aurantia)]